MENHDLDFMKEAIEWANDCDPAKDTIPKVGAIIARGREVIGRGRRGTRKKGDDDHAEKNAIDTVIRNRRAIDFSFLFPERAGFCRLRDVTGLQQFTFAASRLGNAFSFSTL
jgi:pyrimidine deaminase RibD-like protein